MVLPQQKLIRHARNVITDHHMPRLDTRHLFTASFVYQVPKAPWSHGWSDRLVNGWQVSSLPTVQDMDAKAALYSLKVENNKGTLHLTRRLNMDLLMVEVKLYPTLRNFFQVVRTGDEQQIVLQPGAAAASN